MSGRAVLNEQLEEFLENLLKEGGSRTLDEQEDSGTLGPVARRIIAVLRGATEKALEEHGLWRRVNINFPIKQNGEKAAAGGAGEGDSANNCSMFGSVGNGFGTKLSDLDVNIQMPDIHMLGNSHCMREVFRSLAAIIDEMGLFVNTTRILNANVPLLKLTDKQSGMEVDVCFNNELAVRNTKLLHTYHLIDVRAGKLGRLVKEWSKRHDLVGTSDGFLNSYAYTLLVVSFLQQTSPAILPNLQTLAEELKLPEEKHLEMKWGEVEECDTRFLKDAEQAKEELRKKNKGMGWEELSLQSVQELLLGFFEYYTSFNWKDHAVSIRLHKHGSGPVEKACNSKLKRLANTGDGWYVEDPFDLKHNLAEKCTERARTKIQDTMKETLEALRNGEWDKAFPPPPNKFFLKCRVNPNFDPAKLHDYFAYLALSKCSAHVVVHYPKLQSKGTSFAFLEFRDAKARRVAHAENQKEIEGYGAVKQELQLHYSTLFGLEDARWHHEYEKLAYDFALGKGYDPSAVGGGLREGGGGRGHPAGGIGGVPAVAPFPHAWQVNPGGVPGWPPLGPYGPLEAPPGLPPPDMPQQQFPQQQQQRPIVQVHLNQEVPQSQQQLQRSQQQQQQQQLLEQQQQQQQLQSAQQRQAMQQQMPPTAGVAAAGLQQQLSPQQQMELQRQAAIQMQQQQQQQQQQQRQQQPMQWPQQQLQQPPQQQQLSQQQLPQPKQPMLQGPAQPQAQQQQAQMHMQKAPLLPQSQQPQSQQQQRPQQAQQQLQASKQRQASVPAQAAALAKGPMPVPVGSVAPSPWLLQQQGTLSKSQPAPPPPKPSGPSQIVPITRLTVEEDAKEPVAESIAVMLSLLGSLNPEKKTEVRRKEGEVAAGASSPPMGGDKSYSVNCNLKLPKDFIPSVKGKLAELEKPTVRPSGPGGGAASLKNNQVAARAG